MNILHEGMTRELGAIIGDDQQMVSTYDDSGLTDGAGSAVAPIGLPAGSVNSEQVVIAYSYVNPVSIHIDGGCCLQVAAKG